LKALGIDLGSKRIGVATSDRSGTIATPLTTVLRTGDRKFDHLQITKIVQDEEVECVVVGLPLSLSGEHTSAAQAANSEAQQLASVVGVPVFLHDERFTTKTAHDVLMANKMKAQARRRVVDKVAAAVMLQSWLDSRATERST
jgi:putative Holliday junction resolvase